MKRIIFICDHCQKELAGTWTESKRHIRVLKAEIRDNRQKFYPNVNQDIVGDGLHFCNAQCLARYFRNKLKETK